MKSKRRIRRQIFKSFLVFFLTQYTLVNCTHNPTEVTLRMAGNIAINLEHVHAIFERWMNTDDFYIRDISNGRFSQSIGAIWWKSMAPRLPLCWRLLRRKK